MSVRANYECHYLLTVKAYKAAKASSQTSYDFFTATDKQYDIYG